jgi:hypothetical protein
VTSGPQEALVVLAARLRAGETPISAHVVEPVREGYLLHYGTSRLLRGHDANLALLAGDYLYALGIERLAVVGDDEAVAALSELIGRCAQLHTEGRETEVPGLWRRFALAVGGGEHADREVARVNRLLTS